MKYSIAIVGASALGALAYPPQKLAQILQEEHAKRQTGIPSTAAAVALSKARTNCGPTPCEVFDESQLVSTTGSHAYASPAADEIRGPCPGLNAAANHGYLSRSGITTIQETIEGLDSAYGMSADLAGFLAAYAIITGGDPVLGQWSIGGPLATDELTKGALGNGEGISYSHNLYEGDASIGRNDAYLNNGDAHSLNVSRFAQVYALGQADGTDRYTLDNVAVDFENKAAETVATNPYGFFAPVSGLVAPAAYNFVINFMSNHSAEEPSGYLNGAMFKQFFAVTGDYPDFIWLPGQESIPDNWYRRTDTNQYSLAGVFADLGIGFAAYPSTFRLGGNVDGVNTYEGVDLSDFTGGVMSTSDLVGQNNQAACFYTQFIQSITPDAANVAVATLAAINSLVSQYITPATSGLDCPVIDSFDQTLFNQYPGYAYSPTGPDTNYKQ